MVVKVSQRGSRGNKGTEEGSMHSVTKKEQRHC